LAGNLRLAALKILNEERWCKGGAVRGLQRVNLTRGMCKGWTEKKTNSKESGGALSGKWYFNREEIATFCEWPLLKVREKEIHGGIAVSGIKKVFDEGR